MNAQELFLDVSSGRFLDGESAIPTTKPSFFSDEQKRVNISVLKVKNNKLSSVTPSPDSRFKFRLGTTSLKLVDATDVTTAPPTLFTAIGTVSTLSALQAKGQSTITTYSPVTATLEAIVITFPVVTGTFEAKINYVAPVTATLTAGISNVVLPSINIDIPFQSVRSDFLPNFPQTRVLSFSGTLNSPVTATFISTISAGVVTTISIIEDGAGYLDGTYGLSFSSGAASAFAVASNGNIISINLVSGGSAYGSAPTVTLFKPAAQISAIQPTNLLNFTSYGADFLWATCTQGVRADLNFSPLTDTSTPTATSVASAYMLSQGGDLWSLYLTRNGYGYSNAVTVTHDPVKVTASDFRLQPYLGYTNQNLLQNKFKSFSSIQHRNVTTANQITIRSGGLAPLLTSEFSPLGSNYYLGFPAFLTTVSSPSTNDFSTLNGAVGDISPAIFVASPKTTFNPITNNVEGQSFIAVADPVSYKPETYAICRVTYSAISRGYNVVQYFEGTQTGINKNKFTTQPGGGVFEPTLNWLDYGSGYRNNASVVLRPISSLESKSLFSSPINRSASVSTAFGFYPTILSKTPTVVTAFNGSNINYISQDGGFGFSQSGILEISSATVSGGITSIRISNTPTNYIDGEYSCSVIGTTTGQQAQIGIRVIDGSLFPFIRSSGFGYTTAPVVTAPAPNKESGQITGIVVVTRPQGYSLNTQQYLQIASSPVTGGDAVAYFETNENQITNTVIVNEGFGYQSAPTITAPSPDLASKNGYISSINLTNKPSGYIVGQEYDLLIQNSPTVSGSAVAKLFRSDETRFDVSIINSGYGYTSAPLITAPAPDAPQGVLNIVSVTTLGRGYAPGTYNCTVDKAPGGESTAIVNFISESPKVGRFEVVDAGRGYLVAPAVVVPTPAGNVLNQITISCQGNYYINSTANFVISDGSGQGQETSNAILNSGKILGVNVLNGGYGFTNNPTIVFASPTAPVVATIPEYVVQGDLNITVASANAILSTSTQKDILLEVYETDGTNEQVISQATVSLAKRVLE